MKNSVETDIRVLPELPEELGVNQTFRISVEREAAGRISRDGRIILWGSHVVGKDNYQYSLG